jgi:hypothetical protein
VGLLVRIFTIQLTAEQLEVVGLGLDELKFKVAKPVADVIQSQINAQQPAPPAQEASIAEVILR